MGTNRGALLAQGAAAIAIGCLLHGAAIPSNCDMILAFRHPDDDGKTTTAVWVDSRRGAFLFGDALHINTDGTRRSYSVADFWGEERALNNLCNAMSDKCAGMTNDELRARRILTQEARAKGWPPALLSATRIGSNMISFRDGKPCPEIDGYLVSATALHKANMTDVCDLANYVDSLAVPAIVLPPSFAQQGAAVGDLAVVLSADGTKTVPAVVGDAGPRRQIGEGSLALAANLLGKTGEPANYKEVRGREPYRDRGWGVSKAFVLVFAGTRSTSEPYMTKLRIDAAASALLNRWGGSERLKACAEIYSR